MKDIARAFQLTLTVESLSPKSAKKSLLSVASCQELAQTVEASSTVRGGQAAVKLPRTLQIIDKQWDPRCSAPPIHWNCSCFKEAAGMDRVQNQLTSEAWSTRVVRGTVTRRPMQSQLELGKTLTRETQIPREAEEVRIP